MDRETAPLLRDEQHLYRNQAASLLRLHSELHRDRQRELDEADAALGGIYARRVARTLTGAFAFAAMSVVFVTGVASMVYWTFDLPISIARLLSLGLLFTGAAGLAVYLFARAAARVRFRLVLSRELTPTGDLHAEISRLSNADGRAIAARVIERWEKRSVVWPLIGASLALPLAVHYVVACASSHQILPLEAFGLWVGLSAFTVGHCHYFAAHQAVGFARRLGDLRAPSWGQLRHHAWRAVMVAIGTSLMPGLAALGLPCIIVAITAMLCLPISYHTMFRVVVRERAALAAE